MMKNCSYFNFILQKHYFQYLTETILVLTLTDTAKKSAYTVFHLEKQKLNIWQLPYDYQTAYLQKWYYCRSFRRNVHTYPSRYDSDVWSIEIGVTHDIQHCC